MLRAFETAVERSRYEAERGRRQFDACEPENRLVARTLESNWEHRLRDVERAEADLATQRARRASPLSASELERLARAGADLRAIFDAPTTSQRDRKLLLRTLISEICVTVERETRRIDVQITWEGGARTWSRSCCAAWARPTRAAPRTRPSRSCAASPATTTTRRSRACSPASTSAPAPACGSTNAG